MFLPVAIYSHLQVAKVELRRQGHGWGVLRTITEKPDQKR